MPYSAIYIADKSAGRLVVIDPPYYLIGIPFLVIGAGLTFLLLFRSPRQVGLLYFAAAFLVPGLMLSTGTTKISFLRSNQTVHIERICAGLTWRSRTLSLNEVSGAVLGRAAGGGGRSLNLVLKSGSYLSLGPNTDRQGYAEAANAIDEFLESQ